MNVYLYKNDEQIGPYSLSQIQAFVDDGSCAPIDSVWFDGCIDWTTVSNLPGIVISEEQRRQHLVPPFEAYTGTRPYVFVSYAHKDGELVFREIRKLHEAGYRIWYDEGINPGNDWPEHIAKAVIDCDLFLMFTSPRSAASENCRNEVNLALNRKKPFLAVYLEETKLPPGLELRMGDLQAIHKFRMPDTTYRKKLFTGLENLLGEGGRDLPEGEDPVAAALAIEIVADYLTSPVAADDADALPDSGGHHPTKSNAKWIMIGLGTACCIVFLFFFQKNMLQHYKSDASAEGQIQEPSLNDANVSQPVDEGEETGEDGSAKDSNESLDIDGLIEERIKKEMGKLRAATEKERVKRIQEMVNEATSIEIYFATLDLAKKEGAYQEADLLAVQKVSANRNLVANDPERLCRKLLFHGPDEMWEKIKAGKVGVRPSRSQSEYKALAIDEKFFHLREIWRNKLYRFVDQALQIPKLNGDIYIYKSTYEQDILSFGRIREEKDDGKADPRKPKAPTILQTAEIFSNGQRQDVSWSSTHFKGGIRGRMIMLEESVLTPESQFVQEQLEPLLDSEESSIRSPLLDLLDALVRNQELSPLFKAYVHGALCEVMLVRGDEWGLALSLRVIRDYDSLRAIVKERLELTDWMNPAPREAILGQLAFFYQEMGTRKRYAEEAKFNLSFLRDLSTATFRYAGHVDKSGRPSYLEKDEPPIFTWCMGHELDLDGQAEAEVTLQRFKGENALPFSPLLTINEDLLDFFEKALDQSGTENFTGFGSLDDLVPFRYSGGE